MGNNQPLLTKLFNQIEIEKEIFQQKVESISEQLNGNIYFGYKSEKELDNQIKISGEILILCDLSFHIPTKLPYQNLTFSFNFETNVKYNREYNNDTCFLKIIKPAKTKAFPRTEFIYHEDLITKLYKLQNCKNLKLSDFTDLEDLLSSILFKTLEDIPESNKWKKFGCAKDFFNDTNEMVFLHESVIKNLSQAFLTGIKKNNNLEDVIHSVNQEILQYNLTENLSNTKTDSKKMKV